MKKIILTGAAVFDLTFVNAQDKKESNEGFSKGDVFATGAVTFGSSKTGDFKANAFEVAPKVGYFVTENIGLGVMLGYTSEKVELGNSATNTGLGLGAFGRYYFTPANQFSIFAEFGVNYTSFSNEFGIDPDGSLFADDFDSKEIGFSLGAGINYFVSSNFSMEAGIAVLGYSSNDNGGNGAEKTNTFGFGGDWRARAVSFGVNYKF